MIHTSLELDTLVKSLAKDYLNTESKLLDLLIQKKRFVSLAEVIAFMTEEALENHAPEKKLERVRQSKPISSRKFSKDKPLLPKRVLVPQKTKLQKLNEAQNQCSYTSADGRRCQQRLWLELHHKKPISLGGGNEKENLIYLCSSRHRNRHQDRQH